MINWFQMCQDRVIQDIWNTISQNKDSLNILENEEIIGEKFEEQICQIFPKLWLDSHQLRIYRDDYLQHKNFTQELYKSDPQTIFSHSTEEILESTNKKQAERARENFNEYLSFLKTYGHLAPLNTTVREEIFNMTIPKLDKMIKRELIGEGFNSISFYGSKRSGKTQSFEDCARIVPRLFPDQKMISIYHSVGRDNFVSPYDLLYHAIKQVDPQFFLPPHRITIDELQSKLLNSNRFAAIFLDNTEEVYKSKNKTLSLKFLAQLEQIATYQRVSRVFISIGASSHFLPILLKKGSSDYVLLQFPIVKSAPMFNFTKLLGINLPVSWSLEQRDIENFKILTGNAKIDLQEAKKIRFICGSDLIKISNFYNQSDNFDDHKENNDLLNTSVNELYKKMLTKNRHLFGDSLTEDQFIKQTDFSQIKFLRYRELFECLKGTNLFSKDSAMHDCIEQLIDDKMIEIVGKDEYFASSLQKLFLWKKENPSFFPFTHHSGFFSLKFKFLRDFL